MLVRAMLGFTGTAVTNGAIIGNPPRNMWALIQQYLSVNCGSNFLPQSQCVRAEFWLSKLAFGDIQLFATTLSELG